MANPSFNKPLTQSPQSEGIELPSGANAAQSQADFFNNMSQMFSEQARREDERQLQEMEREAREEATERGFEKGTQAAEEGRGPEQKDGDTIFDRTFNRKAVDAWQSQTRIELYDQAEKTFEENKADPKGFRENYEEYVQGVEEELPQEAIPEFRSTAERQKRRFLRQAEQNYMQIKLEEFKAKFNEETERRTKAVRDFAASDPSNPQVQADIKSEFSEFRDFVAKYGPEGEFELAGAKYQGGNGLLGVDEAKEAYNVFRKRTSKELIIENFRQQGSIQEMQKYKNEFAKDMDRSQKEQKIETGTEMVLSDPHRQKILSKMDKILKDMTSIGEDQASRVKQKARLIRDDLKEGHPVNQQEVKNVVGTLSQMNEDSALGLINEIQRASKVNPVAQASWSYTNVKQFENQIEEKQKQINSSNITVEQRQALEDQVSYLQNQKETFKEQIQENMIGYAKKQGQRMLQTYSETDLEKMANKSGMTKEQLKERMTVDELTFEPMVNEEGDIVGVSDETLNSIQERLKDSVFVQKRYNRDKMDVFTQGERKRFNRMIGKLDAEQKNQMKNQFTQALKSEDNDIQRAAYRSLQELSGEGNNEGNPIFVQSAAVSSTNPEAGKNILLGNEVRRQSEVDLVPGAKGVFEKNARKLLVESLGAAKGMEPPTEKINRVIESAKSLAAYDVYNGPIEADDTIDKSKVKKYVDKALGGKKGRGGLGEIGGNKVILPTNLNNNEANSWIETLANPPENVVGESTVTVKEFANIMPDTVEAQELAQFTEFNQSSKLNKKQLTGLMNKIGEQGMAIPGIEKPDKNYSTNDAEKIIKKLNPSETATQKLFGENSEPLKTLSMQGQKPKYPNGEEFNLEDFSNEYKEGTIDFISTSQDGVYYLEIRDSFVLQKPSGGNYKFDMRKLKGNPTGFRQTSTKQVEKRFPF